MNIAQAIGQALAEAGLGRAFGVVGSGNFHVTDALVRAGVPFVAARHENGAATMADAYARMSGRLAALTVHQGCGLTNAMTGITEAAKSRSPLLVLAAETTHPTSNFYVDQAMLASAVGAVPARITTAGSAVEEALAAASIALRQRRTVVLNLPLELQLLPAPIRSAPGVLAFTPPAASPSPQDVRRLAEALLAAERPVFVAGRGSRDPQAAAAVAQLAEVCGALLATSAVAKGLFQGNPWNLDVSGGFSSPLSADLISHADLIIGWGCSLTMWTVRHGRLIADGAVVVQVDDNAEALGMHRELTFGVLGDVVATAQAVVVEMGALESASPASSDSRRRYRDDRTRQLIASRSRWRDEPYEDLGGEGRIDPRTLTLQLDRLLPVERVVSVDSGNFMGYPSMFLSVPDQNGFCLTQAFQSVGLGLATAVGAALAQPHRLPVAAMGDGGALMAAAELETVVRLGLGMVVVVYNDDAYGAEVHHFGPAGFDLGTVTFPPTDLAGIARGYGFTAVTVREQSDLDGVRRWLDGDRATPLLIDAKVTRAAPSWWLEEAFRGH